MRTNILFLFTILVSGIILASCGEKAKTEDYNIVGKWEYKNITFDLKTSDEEAAAKIIAFVTKDSNENKGLTAEFTNDGRVIGSDGELQTYSISGDEITTNFENMSGKNKFQIKSDTLSIFEDISGMFNNKDPRTMVGIADSLIIEKAVIAVNFVRKK